MKRLLPIALVAISLLSMTLFFIIGQNKLTHAASQTSLMLIEHDTTTKHFGSKQNLNGTYDTFTNPIYDATDKIRIGSSDGTCFYVSQSVDQCEWTIVLPTGKLVLLSADKIQDVTVTDAVIGGTGAYKGAKGEAVLHYTHTQKESEYSYTFYLA